MIAKLRRWLAKSLLDAQQRQWEDFAINAINQAYQNGSCHGYQLGYTKGIQDGMSQAFTAVQAAVDERNGLEVTQADLDRARKGLVH